MMKIALISWNMSFKDLHVMDVLFQELREEGVGAVVKHAPVILPKEEDMLWKWGILGDHSPLAL